MTLALAVSPAATGRADAPFWSPRQVRALTATALLAAVLVRAWLLLGQSIGGDSLVLVGSIAAGEAGPDRSLLELAGAHLALALAPLDFWPLALVLLALWVAYCGTAWMAACELLQPGARRLALLLLLIYSPLTIPGLSTWPIGAEQSAFAVGSLLVVVGAARLHRSGRTVDAWLLPAGVLVAMAGSSSVAWGLAWITGAWAVALVWIPHMGSGDTRLRVRRALATSGLAVLPLVAWALLSSSWPVAALPRDLGAVAAFVGQSIGSGLVPGLAGGPVAWSGDLSVAPTAAAPAWVVAAGIQVLLIGMATTLFLTGRGLLPWGVGLFATGLALFVTAMGTSPLVAGAGGQLLGLAAAPALLAPAAAACLAAVPRPARGATPSRGGAHPHQDTSLPSWLDARTRAVIGVIAVDAFLAISAMTTIGWSDARATYPGEDYVANARAALASAPREVPVLPQIVPPNVVNPAYAPLNRTDVIFAPVDDRPAFADWTPALQVFDSEGSLRPARVAGIPVPVTCTDTGLLVGELPRLPNFGYVIEIVLAAPDLDGFAVTLGDGEPVAVPPDPSRTRVFVQVVGGGDTLEVSSLGAGRLCADSLRIGQAEPIDAPAPEALP